MSAFCVEMRKAINMLWQSLLRHMALRGADFCFGCPHLSQAQLNRQSLFNNAHPTPAPPTDGSDTHFEVLQDFQAFATSWAILAETIMIQVRPT